ncbi:hypothetical protein PENTCL1PPCAC_9039 [Pristionchus entomophagus]|uniref:BTB domain-containing protein n=1 Tax=Pristionchus entomophagus TaxID=358040 RepID=A0AAV5SZW2_9BILA|nr:hypothetical protein PENTCL1PPCAC_9039 [Pristionchus entomophagus]
MSSASSTPSPSRASPPPRWCARSIKIIRGRMMGCVAWDVVIDEKKGFIKDDKITVEMRFSITSMKGVRGYTLIDFTDPNKPRHDVALIINGEKIYANKAILAFHSPFFHAMFFGNFSEKTKAEIELKDVDREEFLDMLTIMPPSSKPILYEVFPCVVTLHSVEHLLKLGDRFQIACVIERVEEFLMQFHHLIRPVEKLRMADQYRLFGLKEYIFDFLERMQDFKDVKIYLRRSLGCDEDGPR